MKSLKEYIFDAVHPSELVVEMATFGQEKFGKDIYRIAVHGPASKDREQPHIHIHLANDKAPYNKFNFEVSLVDILCKDEINLIYQRDAAANILRKNRDKCSWEGYRKLRDDFEDWLFSNNVSEPGEFIDNLDVAIYHYNKEADYEKFKNGENALKEYLNKHGFKVLKEYEKYFM